jgi:hypothetical protein
MPTFLDLRTSQFAPAAGTNLSNNAAAPTFLGGIGLIVGSATNIRVDLNATVSVQSPGTATVTILIARNIPAATISTFNAGNVIYSTTETVFGGEQETVGVNAADFNPTTSPTEPGQINYSLFAYSSATDTLVGGRVQTLNGVAAAG